MTSIALHQPTAIPLLDQTLSSVIALVEQHLPTRVLGYYLVGSYAVGEAVPASDVDLLVVFKDDLTDADRQQFAAVRAPCQQLSPYTLDLIPGSAPHLMRVGGVWFHTASRCLYGEDIRSQIPRKPVPMHLRDLMHSVYPLLARVRGNPPRLTVPLAYPDASLPFYGYDQRVIVRGDQRRTVGTKDIVTNVLAIANVRTLQAAGQYVGAGKKADIPQQYGRWVNDHWTGLVTEVYETCRNRWVYAVPRGQAEQTHLRHLCHDVLAFENDFLAVYGGFLVQELQHRDTVVLGRAVERLGSLIYPDQEVVRRLRQLLGHSDAALVSAVGETLTWYRNVPA